MLPLFFLDSSFKDSFIHTFVCELIVSVLLLLLLLLLLNTTVQDTSTVDTTVHM
jgi:hypothetical protein